MAKEPKYSWDAIDEEAVREARATRRLKGMAGNKSGNGRVNYGAKQAGNQTGSSRSPRRK